MLMPKDTVQPEIEIRGLTLKISVTIEAVLMKIVFFTSGELYAVENSDYLKVKYVSFGDKVSRLRELLKKYHPDLAKRNKNLLNRLDKFVTFRNQLCHAALTWKDRKPDVFIIWDIKEDPNKNEIFNPIEYVYQERLKYLSETLAIVFPKLSILSNEVQLRLQIACPQVYQKIDEEYKRQKGI
jgi:hypothetical protein